MDNQPPLNRELIFPILLGGFSIIGIVAVLLLGRSLSASREAPMTPSATPFRYLFLGTEPAITTPLVEGSEIVTSDQSSIDVLPSATTDVFSGITPPVLRTPTRSSSLSTPTRPSSLATPLILSTLNVTSTSGGLIEISSTPSRTPTATTGTALAANTYDDTNPSLQYIGTWISQTGVSEAHQGTLHISNTITDSVTFTFTGQEIHV